MDWIQLALMNRAMNFGIPQPLENFLKTTPLLASPEKKNALKAL
jgi:hypothetical protein